MKGPSVELENIKKIVLPKKIGKAGCRLKMEVHHTKFKESNLVPFPFDAYSAHLTHRLIDCADTEEILILRLILHSHHLSRPLNL
jgi:hypothetical protein